MTTTPIPAGKKNKIAANRIVFHKLIDTLQERIRNGTWLPGERLPSIQSLSQEFQVSPASVREALRSLQSMGIVKIEHGRGVFVITSRDPTELAAYFQDLNLGLVIALAETRQILEPELSALAAERASNEELDEIVRLAHEMEMLAEQGADFSEPDVMFHRKIAQASHNPVLGKMIDSVNDLLLQSRRLTASEPGMTARAVRYHLLIAHALHERNATLAHSLMFSHMRDTLNSILRVESRFQERRTKEA